MKRLILIPMCIMLTGIVFSQNGSVYNGWIRTDLNVGQKSSDKVRQNTFTDPESGTKGNVWLESTEGWLKLCYSVQKDSKKTKNSTFQESIPIYDGGSLLWESGKLHRLDGPFYFFEFKIFNITRTSAQGKNTKVSLYYRWVINPSEEDPNL